MNEYIVKTIVTYKVFANTTDEAQKMVERNTEHPIFPNTAGECVYDEIMSVELASKE